MARIFITGSADGLGRTAAQTLLQDGHEVVVHARNPNRLAAVGDLLHRGAEAVVGDLSDLEETRGIAGQVNRLGPMDAVIHNAGVISGTHVLPVNVVAPYLLTALIERPQRLIYLSSGMHRGGRPRSTRRTGADSTRPAPTRTANCSSRRSPSPSRATGRTCSAMPSIPDGCRRRWAAPAHRTICGSGT